jgi:Chitobiase/beta-hexosaminidase C-terminal domain/Putative Ig domain
MHCPRVCFRDLLIAVSLLSVIATTLQGCASAPSNAGQDFASLIITTTSSLPNGQVGTAYSTTLVATGGKAPYSWTLTSGSLPIGLSLNASTGAITGTPTPAVTSTPLTFKVTDSSTPALFQTANLTLTIAPATLVIPTTSLPSSVSDTFLRANGALGSNWTSIEPDGTIQVISHAYASGSGTQTGFPTQYGIWAGGQPFSPDQLISAQISAIAAEWSVVSITAATYSAGNTTYNYTLTSGAALQTNQEIIVSGMTHGGNNGNFLITALGGGTFTVVNASGVTATESGTGISPADSLCGVGGRFTPDGHNLYGIYVGNNSAYVGFNNGTVPDNRLYVREMQKVVNNVYTYLASGGPSNNYNPIPDAVNDIFTVGLMADKFCLFKNGAILQSLTDESLTSGLPGIITTSAQAAGQTMPLGSNVGNDGTQWTNFAARDLQLTPPGWVRQAWDNMNGASGNFNANWAIQNIYPYICTYSGTGFGEGNGVQNSSAIYTGRTWNDNHSSTVVIYTATGNIDLLILTRAGTADETFYGAVVAFTSGLGVVQFSIRKWIAGVSTGVAGPVAGTVNFGDVIRMESNGSTHTLYQNGVVVLTANDSSIASGAPGLLMASNLTPVLYWEGDEPASTQAATPVLSPPGGNPPQTVTISSTTPNAYIYYTTDGSVPSTGSNLYTGPISVLTNQTIRAIAVAGGFLNSGISQGQYGSGGD